MKLASALLLVAPARMPSIPSWALMEDDLMSSEFPARALPKCRETPHVINTVPRAQAFCLSNKG